MGSKERQHIVDRSQYRAAEKQSPSAGVQEAVSEHLGTYRLHTAKTMLLCQGTLIFSIPIPLHSRADCCMLYPEIQGAESKPCISHVPCFLCWEAGRALGTAGLSAMLAQPWLQASDSSIVLPYIHDSLEVGKILLLQNCPVPMAKGQGDLSRAGDSFLGHTFPGFVCFVFSWKALPHAYLVQHFKSSLLEENMLLT